MKEVSTMENKKHITFRLSHNAEQYIQQVSSQNGITQTAALEQIISEHQANAAGQTEQIADALLKKMDEKYGKTFDRIRFASTAAERYTMQLIELANVFFYADPKGYNFMSTSVQKTKIVELAENAVKQKIALFKQKSDFSKKDGEGK